MISLFFNFFARLGSMPHMRGAVARIELLSFNALGGRTQFDFILPRTSQANLTSGVVTEQLALTAAFREVRCRVQVVIMRNRRDLILNSTVSVGTASLSRALEDPHIVC